MKTEQEWADDELERGMASVAGEFVKAQERIKELEASLADEQAKRAAAEERAAKVERVAGEQYTALQNRIADLERDVALLNIVLKEQTEVLHERKLTIADLERRLSTVPEDFGPLIDALESVYSPTSLRLSVAEWDRARNKARAALAEKIAALQFRLDGLKALVGTIRDLAGCERRNVDDVTPEQHSREIMARFNEQALRLSTAAIEAEALERWRVRAERAESRLEALRSVAYDAITRLADQMTVETEHLWPCLVNLHAMVQPTAVEKL